MTFPGTLPVAAIRGLQTAMLIIHMWWVFQCINMILALSHLKQEDQEFKVSLNLKARPMYIIPKPKIIIKYKHNIFCPFEGLNIKRWLFVLAENKLLRKPTLNLNLFSLEPCINSSTLSTCQHVLSGNICHIYLNLLFSR